MARTPFICGNWKMHKTVGEAVELIDGLLPRIESLAGVEVGVAPTFTALHAVSKRITGSKIRLSAQNCHFEGQGAFTGEISVGMLKDVGCMYSLVGHSERRTLFGETNDGCAKKISALFAGGMLPIYCVGETLEQRDGNQTLSVVTEQLLVGLGNLDAGQVSSVVVAYEPVWAIGTGRTATPDQAQEVHAHLRAELAKKWGEETAQAVRIQYGGSMKPANAAELLAQPDIDGGLIGGAALKADSFAEICAAAA
ncbi:MAG: triose-phosphate isomerase [Deltaproteobacteria bacterium]